jgi:dihydropteroate synthase
MRTQFTINACGHQIHLGTHTKIMGIINITPDSFSQDGCMRSSAHFHDRAYRQALKQIRDGADILDIGGESTRPGAPRVEAEEEIRRIIPVIKRLIKKTAFPISVDTNKSIVAKAALDAGANIINNIRGVRPNTGLLKMVARYDAAIVLMHIGHGTPRTMQKRINHEQDIIQDIFHALKESIEKCLEIGIKSDKIIIDPGIGFGKTLEHNLIIMNRLKKFQALKMPVLIGTSRKSFIGLTLNKDIHERLTGTAATVSIGIHNGAHIVRVHDVKVMSEIARMSDAILNEKVR